MRTGQITVPLALVIAAASAVAAQAPRPARVDFEVLTDSGGPPTAAQQWYTTLTDLKVDSLRVRARAQADVPEIKTSGTRASPVYKVAGLINRSGELIVPGGRFRTTDRARLSEWLTKLREEGPERAGGGPRLPYGLTKEQFGEVYEDLSRPISFATMGMKPVDFVNRAADVITLPLTGTGVAEVHLRAAEPIDVDLQGTTAGTAFAFVLRRADLALVPQLDAGRRPELTIVPARAKQERWPLGWPPKAPKRDLVPAIFDLVDVELKDVEAPRILGAIGEHVPVPMLIDRTELAREKIDLGAIKVTMPAKRSTYDAVLRKVFVPKGMTHEVRVDEANKPFLWITTARAAAADEAPVKESER